MISTILSVDKMKIIIPFLLFVVLLTIGLYNHEMWRDELYVWLIAQNSPSYAEFLGNVRYDGKTALWESLEYIACRINDNPVSLQILHGLIISLAVLLILKYSPFSQFQKIALIFGYFIAYEYAIISRDFVLILLLWVISLICISKRNSWGAAISLGLLAFTHFLGAILASAAVFSNLKLLKKKVIIFFVFLLLLAVETWGQRGEKLVRPDLSYTFDNFFCAMVPVPDLQRNMWNTNLFKDEQQKFKVTYDIGLRLRAALGFLLFLSLLVLFMNVPVAGIMFLLGFGGLLLFFQIYYLGFVRHYGLLFLVYIGAMWLFNGRNPSRFFRPVNKIFSTVLVIQMVAFVPMYVCDIIYPFSGIKEASMFIKSNNLDKIEIAGSPGFITAHLGVYLKKPIWNIATGKLEAFYVYGKENSLSIHLDDIYPYLKKMQLPPEILIVTNGKLKIHPIGDFRSEDLELLHITKPSIVDDEQLYIYRWKNEYNR